MHGRAPHPVPSGELAQPGPATTATEPSQSEDRCKLPPVTGPCKAMFRRYHFDPSRGACREFVYGGCHGNANSFATAAECLVACATTDDVRAAGDTFESGNTVLGCMVGNDVYPSGADRVPRPSDCNTCKCRGGMLQPCTKRGCPDQPRCPDGTHVGTSCAEAGTTGGCMIVETACLPICTTDADCKPNVHALCSDGLCRMGQH